MTSLLPGFVVLVFLLVSSFFFLLEAQDKSLLSAIRWVMSNPHSVLAEKSENLPLGRRWWWLGTGWRGHCPARGLHDA